MNQQTFGRCMALMEAYFEKEIASDIRQLYWRQFQHENDAIFTAACERAIQNLRWFPKIAELRAFMGELVMATGRGIQTGDQVWPKVLSAARRWYPGAHGGWDSSSKVDTWIADAVRQVGGIQRIAMGDAQTVGYCRRDFIAIYDKLRERHILANPEALTAIEEGNDAKELQA